MRAERAGALDRALESYVQAARTSDACTRAEALRRQADVYRARCDWDRALAAVREAQMAAAGAGLQRELSDAIIAETNILISRGNFSAAIPKLEALATTSADAEIRGIALQNLGSVHAQTGQPRAAERAFRESLGNFQRAGYVRGQGIALNNLGRLALDCDDAKEARPLLERALQLAQEVEDSDLAALARLNLASALCCQDEVDRAQDLAMAALGYYADCGNRWREIECLRLIGDINVRCRDVNNASRCYDLALSIAQQIGSATEVRITRDRLAALKLDPSSGTRTNLSAPPSAS